MERDSCKWSKNNHSIFESFAIELQEFWAGGRTPRYGNQMLSNALEKQRDHLKKHELRMTYEMMPNGHFAENAIGKGWMDQLFSNYMECRTCCLTRRIYKGEKQIYKQKENVNLYITITSALDKNMIAKEAYYCPNCGALSTVSQLEDSCPYCQTKFKMTDLYPKVTNYFTVTAYGGTKKEVKHSIWRTQLPFIMISTAYLMYRFNFVDVRSDHVLLNCLSAVLAGGVFGFIIGYMVFALTTLTNLFKDAGRSVSMLVATRGSQKRFVSLVKEYSPEFSYEYFTDKVVSILKQLLSEEKVSDNPYYVGPPVDLDTESIIEYTFKGAVALKDCHIEGHYCRVTVDVYMKDYYYKGSRIRKKDDVFQMSLRKDLSKKINYAFSLSAIQCRSCGASFDAAKTKKCPSCGSEYAIEDDDWIVMGIFKH